MTTLPNHNDATITQRARSLTILCVLCAFFCVFAVNATRAQTFPLQVQVSVLPPYSAYLQDYPGAGQQVRVFLINTSRSTYQIRLAGQLTGDNGIEIRTSPNYRPPRPLTVPPGQTLLNRNDLEGLFDLNQIEVTGIDKNLLARGFPLPDGTYQLCVRAYNETATNTAVTAFGQPLSAEFPLGCSAPIVVRSVEPPILISPLCDAEVTATTPQAVVFTWTPPAGVSPAQVDYTLRVVELPQVDVDPNVFIDAVALPKSGVEVRNLRTSTFLYGPTQPPLVVGRRYAWRVQAIDHSRKLNFQNDGKSPVCSFTYGVSPVIAQKSGVELVQTPILSIPGLVLAPKVALPDSNLAGTGKAPVVMKSKKICKAMDLPASTNPQTGPLNGETVKLGEFDLTIATATAQNGSYAGTGRIVWNGAPIKVNFTNLKVNAQNQVFDGEVESDSKGPGMPSIPLGQIDGYGKLPPNYFDQIKNTLADAAKQAVAIPLPLKYDSKLGTIGVNRMSFSPVGADMDLVLGVSLPEANLNLFLAAVEVCIRPQKTLPNTGTLYLVQDFPMPIPGGIGQKFVFKKSDPNSSQPSGTYAAITNGDFDKVHAILDLNLGSNILKADDGKGNVKGGDLVGTITADFVQWADWVGTVSLPSFQVPSLKGITFTGNDIVYDHSDKANPAGFNLPKDYTGDKGLTFHGTYFKKLTVELPSSFKSDPRIGIAVNSGIIDESGFTGLISAANKPILDYTKGSLAGFGFSIEDIQWTIVQNSNRGGNMVGQLQFPISTDAFSYSCSLSAGFDNIQFTTSPKEGYHVPLFAANMDLNSNTSIVVAYKSGQSAKVSMNLEGIVSVDVKKFAGSGTVGQVLDGIIPKLCFQKFTIANTQTPGATALGGSGLYMNAGNWNLSSDCATASAPTPVGNNPKSGGGPWSPDEFPDEWVIAPTNDQKPSLGGFPLDFDQPKMVATKEGAGLRLGIGLHLGETADDASFVQAHGTLDILGTITSEGGRFKPVYKGTYPRSLSIAGGIGPLTVNGGVDFFTTDSQYGNGLKGNATVEIPGFDVKLKMMMLFGNVSGFKYGFVDGSVQFPAGVPIVGPIVMTGLGGGMHYNMAMAVGADKITSLPKPTTDNKTPLPAVDLTKPGKTMSGQVYTPKQGAWGFTAKLYAGLVDPHVFNASLAMTINFANGTLGGINLHGNANVISTSGDGDGKDGVVHAVMDIAYAQSVLDASLDVDASFLTATAHIPFSLHVASNSDWFVKVGDPSNEANRINVNLLNIGNDNSALRAYLGANGYVAAGVGPNLNGLPPVPKDVSDFLLTGTNTLPEHKAAYQNRQLPDLTPIGPDYKLLMGGRLDGTLNVQVQPFRLWAKATVGFDVALAKNVKCGGSNEIPQGLFGWYGQGQAYTYLAGGIDLYVDVWFFSGSLSLMELQAGAVLKAGFPDPTWADGKVKVKGEVLDGLISVETTQDFSFGAKCTPVYNGDPLKDLIIISDMSPGDGDTDVSTLPTMAVSFNMPMDKVFTINLSEDDVRHYKFVAQAPVFSIKPKGSTTYKAVTDLNPIKWASDKKSYTLSVSAYQPSYATCQLTQLVAIKQVDTEYSQYAKDPIDPATGKATPRTSSKTVTFTLAKQPDDIPLEAITRSWPINGQHYFLKKQASKGFLRGKFKGLECLNESGMQYTVNFRGADNNLLSTPIQYDGASLITFSLPEGLKNQQTYSLEISKQAGKPASGSSSKSITSSSYVTLAQSPKLQLYRTTLNASAVQAMAAVNQSNQGKKLFGLNFTTSKYNTFAEKINGLNLKASDYKGDQTIDLKPASGNFERFDTFELFSDNQVYNNFKLGQSLIKYTTPLSDTPYDNEILKKIYWKIRRLTEDGSGTYSTNTNWVSDDFKIETLAQTYSPDPYDRETYTGIIRSVYGQPQRVLFPKLAKEAYNPVNGPLAFQFVRDKLAGEDLGALVQILNGLRILNKEDVARGQKYTAEKDMNPQTYLIKRIHDPNAEPGYIYQSYSFDPNGYGQYVTIDASEKLTQYNVQYDQYGSIVGNSPSLQLYIQDFHGQFYRKSQEWSFAEDPYYGTTQYDYGVVPQRGKNSPFTVSFAYGTNYDELLPAVTVTKAFTIGSINDSTFTPIALPHTPVFYYLPGF